MTRLLRAVAAAMMIVALLIGVPALLMTVAGWPLPTSMPDWDNVYWSARQGDIPAEFVIKAFACVVWLAWAQIAWALLWELVVNVPRTLRGRAERSSPVTAAPASRLARRLVTAAMLLTAMASTPATTAAAPSLASFMSSGGPNGPSPSPATLVVGHDDTTRASLPSASVWVSGANDTLWDVAERCLGDGSRVDEVLKCNPHLDPGRTLREGQRVTLPAGVTPPADRAAAESTDSAASGEVEKASPGHAVTAVSGDTVWDLTDAHYGRVDTDLIAEVAAASGLDDPSVLMPGDVVVFPELDTVGPAPSVDPRPGWDVHQVVRGDTLWDIVSTRYGNAEADTVWAVASVNDLDNPSLIVPGQAIQLPPADELARLVADPNAAIEPPVAAPADLPASDSPAVPVEPTPPTESTPASDSAPPDPVPAPEAPQETPDHVAEPDVVAPLPPPTTGIPTSTSARAPEEPAVATATTGPATTSATETATTSTPSRDVGDGTRVEAEDMLSSRWLFGGIAATSLGLFGAWLTVKHLRRRRRRWLGLADPQLEHPPEQTEREDTALLDVSMLTELVDPELRSEARARAVLLGDHTEIRFRGTTPSPPAGWEVTGDSWRQLGDDEPWTPARVLSPALVTIGHDPADGTREVVLDLLTAGTVSVTGDRVAVERLVCSMLWELAADPLGQPVDLVIVGLACAAAQHATNVGRQLTMDEAIQIAREPAGVAPQVFLVDPFADETAKGTMRELTDACAPGSGRAVVVAGPCEQPSEQISVPSEHRAMWDDLTLTPPQLPEQVDVQLGRMLDSIAVGRRDRSVSALAVTPDPEAEAVVLRSTVMIGDPEDGLADGEAGGGSGEGDWFDPRDSAEPGASDPGDGDDDPAAVTPSAAAPVEPFPIPEVVLTVCGRTIGVQGFDVARLEPVLFVLAAAGRKMHTNEVAELTGYSTKSVYNAFGSNHELVGRGDGEMWLADHVMTDHGWMRRCVSQLAAAMSDDDQSPATREWTVAAMEALGRLEQAPYAVLPKRSQPSRSKRSAWEWVDEFPWDTPARDLAQTELAESALAFSELWLASTAHHDVVRSCELVGELCRLAATVPYAHVVRQLRQSQWESGAACLLIAAARVAGEDESQLGRVQQCARELAAREALEASNELADALGL